MVNFSDCIGVVINLGFFVVLVFLSLNLHGIIQQYYLCGLLFFLCQDFCYQFLREDLYYLQLFEHLCSCLVTGSLL